MSKLKTFLIFNLSIILGLYFVELILSINIVDKFINSNNKTIRYCENTSNCDYRSSLDIYYESKKKGDPIYPNFTPVYRLQSKNFNDYKTSAGDEIFPLSKVSKQKTSMCNENGEWVIFKTDQYGLNNDYNDYKNSDIFILGDSYVEGHCSFPENNIAGQLKNISNLKIINLGLAGSGPLMMLASAREYALKFNPKILIWYHFHNDIINLERYEKNSKTLMRYLSDEKFDQKLIERQNEIDEVVTKFVYEKVRDKIFTEYFSLRTFFKLWYTRTFIKKTGLKTQGLKTKNNIPNINDFSTYEKILSQIQSLTQKKNIDFYFIFLPDITGVFPNKYQHYEKIDSRNDVIKIAKNYFGENTLDLTDMLIKNFKNPKDLFIGGLRGNHYTDEGYRFVAEKTLKLINNN